ncbi:MAG: EamA family transporter [Planctomycetes bacterium]|nr:EamA family transporter [Planctomycetota bacterium]NOG53435.1 DMT family transporter [Planctomycetota bacterium]
METAAAYVGIAAGVTTSLLWVATSLLFTAAGHRIGPTIVNGIRIVVAIVLLGVTHRILFGLWIPGLDVTQVLLLGASGVVGLAIGDQALFTSFVYIGPRVATLVMASSPIVAAALGWVFLDEHLTISQMGGIGLVLVGVGWVILERPRSDDEDALEQAREQRTGSRYRAGYVYGCVLAFVGSACQAGGLLLSKRGMGHGWLPAEAHLDPLAATLVRMVFAAVGMIPILMWNRALRERRRKSQGPTSSSVVRIGTWRAGLAFTVCGAVVGPFLGVWLSLVACDLVPLGIAQTLISLSPVFILPFAVLIHRERLTMRAIGGACLAVVGIAVLSMMTAGGDGGG